MGNMFHAYQVFRYTSNVFNDSKRNIYKWIILIIFGCTLDLFDLSNLKSSFLFYIFDVLALNLILNLMFKVKKYLSIFIAGNIVLYFLSIRAVVLSFMSSVLNKPFYYIIVESKYYNIWGFFTVVVLILTFPIFRNMYSLKKLKMVNAKEMKSIVGLQYMSILIIIISSIPYYYNIKFIWLNFYNGFNYIACTLLNYVVFVYVYTRSQKKEYERKSNLFENQLNYNLQNYNNKALYIERLRAFRHDYKGIMSTAKMLLESNDINKLKILLSEVDFGFNNIENLYEEFSNNSLLQAIMSSFYNKCKDNNILFEGKIFLPEYINLTDYEKCRIFHNLLNNAFEACCYKLDKNNYIKIYTNVSELWFSVVIENSFDGYLKKYKEEFLSRKKDSSEHGFGIRNVIDIVEEKNGFVNIENDDRIFKVSLNLPI